MQRTLKSIQVRISAPYFTSPQLTQLYIIICWQFITVGCCVQANPELTAVWAVGQRIWQRDFPGIYTAIAAYQWTETILPVMEALRGKKKKRSFPLITCICHKAFHIDSI